MVDALLDQNIEVRALCRSIAFERVRQLARRGVAIVEGEFDDRKSLDDAMRGAAGVFSIQLPPRPDDLESEVRAGQNLVEAASTAGLDIFVHTSVARPGDEEQFQGWNDGRWWRDYWTSKSRANEVVKAAGFPHWVILKPAFMMYNFVPPKVAHMFPSLAHGRLETAMASGTKLDLVAAEDIGRFAAAAFVEVGRFDRQEIDLAGDSLTMDEVASVITEVTGTPIRACSLSYAHAIENGIPARVVESQQWANVEGYKVDLARVRSYGIPLASFATWARTRASDFVVN